ncbi:MFS transporter [Teredinibacter franksiae]|uniref:MFS transporter n=1 Tax=Teredinibacter franksiae TaxID=2761453 RepID=UPI001FE4C871|nr:MFS transporter [Teredinibacter franksiae]
MPYWRLSAVYFCYFAVVGALSPYWGLYLADLGYRPIDIGLISAIPMLTKLAAPNIWGVLADSSGRRLLIIQLGALGACVFFCRSVFKTGFLLADYGNHRL